MTPTFAVIVAVAAGSIPVLALLGFDPAYASVLNFALLVYAIVFTQRERMESVAAARELARTAKGSEDRATRAAAEISRSVAEKAAMNEEIRRHLADIEKHSRATAEHVDKALVEVIVLAAVTRDRLAQLKVEHDLLADPDPREGVR